MRQQNLQLRKIHRHIVDVIGSPYLLRAPGKIDVPVWNMTGTPLASAAR